MRYGFAFLLPFDLLPDTESVDLEIRQETRWS